MMVMLHIWTWKNECAPKRCKYEVVLNLFENGDKAAPGNYRGMTLLSTVGKILCKILNGRMGTMMKKGEQICEGQTELRPNRSCVDYLCTLGSNIHGRKERGANNVPFLSRCTEGL